MCNNRDHNNEPKVRGLSFINYLLPESLVFTGTRLNLILLLMTSQCTNDAQLQKDLKSLQHWEEMWLLNVNISICDKLELLTTK